MVDQKFINPNPNDIDIRPTDDVIDKQFHKLISDINLSEQDVEKMKTKTIDQKWEFINLQKILQQQFHKPEKYIKHLDKNFCLATVQDTINYAKACLISKLKKFIELGGILLILKKLGRFIELIKNDNLSLPEDIKLYINCLTLLRTLLDTKVGQDKIKAKPEFIPTF